jgi:3'-5' exoribonuclease
VGALLHDIGKIMEYEVAGDFRYTLEGKFQGHIVQGHSQVDKWIRQIPDFPERLALEVLHILLSHHGQLEYGSPKMPVTAEALVIHFADDLDAKLDMVKTAGEEPGTEEAFVKGLRRSFLFRNEGEGEEGSSEGESGREGEGEKEQETETRGRGDAGKGEEEPSEGESGREGEREKTKSRREPDKSAIGKGKREGQEELF